MSRPDADRFAELAELAELGLLSASLFHEIRQPLFVLKGLVDLAIGRRVGLGEEELRLLRQELAHVEALVEHYGALQPRPGPPTALELGSAVRAAVDALGPRARQSGVSLRFVPGGPVEVVARAVAVRQVVVNLVSNAIDASATGGRTVEVTTRQRAGGPAEIEVLDDGPGLDPEVAHRLAEPFVTTKPAGAGTGLGLYITRRLAEEWGGRLVLEPGPGGRGVRAAVTFGSRDQR